MNEQHFEELLASVREAGRIMRQEQAPSRAFYPESPDVGTIQKQTGLPQGQFATLLGVRDSEKINRPTPELEEM